MIFRFSLLTFANKNSPRSITKETTKLLDALIIRPVNCKIEIILKLKQEQLILMKKKINKDLINKQSPQHDDKNGTRCGLN